MLLAKNKSLNTTNEWNIANYQLEKQIKKID